MTGSHSYGNQKTILHGLPLRLAQIGWWAVTLAVIALQLVGLPSYYRHLTTVCDTQSVICQELGRPTSAQAGEFAAVGLTLDQYATIMVGLESLILVIWIGIGVVIFALRSSDWMAMLVSMMLIVFSSATFIAGPMTAAAASYPVLSLPTAALAIFGEILIVAFFLFFPNGQLVPRWLWWLIPFRAIAASLDYLPEFAELPASELLSSLFLFPAVVLMLVVQAYRYHALSTPRERNQTRWVLFGVTSGLGAFVIIAILAMLTGFWQSSWAIMAWTGMNAIATLIPITFAIAILRSNLWDIDVVIRRTTVYATLTAILALVYFGSVIVLQRLLAPFTGESTPAVVLSTLLIAALFLPLRQRVQDMIDRRFFRNKYDAEKVMERFAATVRDETDLDALTAELIRVIQETMQPEHASIWLRPIAGSRPPTDEIS
jgi:hypothetical protein